MACPIAQGDHNKFRADDKAQKGIRQGDWTENLLQLQCYVHRLRDAFAELDKLITITCTLPVSTASCERSFSTLQIVKYST